MDSEIFDSNKKCIQKLFELYLKTGRLENFTKEAQKIYNLGELDLLFVWLAFDRAAEEWQK